MKHLFTLLGLATALFANAQWNQIGQNVPGTEEESAYGWRVSISDDGTTIAVGAPFASENGLFGNGRVEVYRLIDNQWIQLGSDIIGTFNNEEMGSSISLSEDGNTMAVARPWAGGGNTGMVNVYTYSNGTWSLLGATIVGAAAGNGGAVALSNNGLTVAATSGSACSVYEFDGSNWVNVATRSGNQTMFAVALSADGTRVIFAGMDWLHAFDKVNGVWSGVTNFLLSGDDGTVGSPNFLTMSGDGNVFAKGAESNDDGGFNTGKVLVVDRTNPDSWIYANFTGNGSAQIGKSISLNHDGSVMSVLGTQTQIYTQIEGTWTLTQTISGATSSAVAINGAGDVIGTGYRYFTVPLLGEVGVMRAYGNNPNAAPSIDCPANLTVNTDAGACGAVLDLEAVFATDLEDGSIEAVQTDGLASGSFFPAGMHEVTFTATDSQGLTASCTYTITVVDVELPTLECAATTVQLNAEGMASLALLQVLTDTDDNCGIALESLSQSEFTCADLGLQEVEVTVTDIHGNANTCLAEVTVVDVIAPEIACQNVTVSLNDAGEASLLTSQLVAAFSDNCGTELVDTPLAWTCSDLGIQLISVAITDASGNVATCISSVTVEDSSAPLVTCQNIELALNAQGQALLTASEVDLNSSDNCTLSFSLSATDFTCDDLGTQAVTLTGEDAAGNTATCVAEVTVVDVTAPEIECPADLTVSLLAGETYLLADFVAAWETALSDICTAPDDLSLVQMPSPGTALDLGEHEISFTVTDASGNESACSMLVTVEVVDHIAEAFAVPFTMHPNPASHQVTLTHPYVGTLTLTLYDLTGRAVHTTDLGARRSVDVSMLPNGEYIVRLHSAQLNQVGRLVVVR